MKGSFMIGHVAAFGWWAAVCVLRQVCDVLSQPRNTPFWWLWAAMFEM